MVTVNGQPPMVDEQAIILFLRQLDRALAAAEAVNLRETGWSWIC